MSEPTETDILKARILQLHQALVLTNNDRTKLFLSLKQISDSRNSNSKQKLVEPKPEEQEPDLIDFSSPAEKENAKTNDQEQIKTLQNSLKTMKLENENLSENSKNLLAEIEKLNKIISEEKLKSEKLQKDNLKLANAIKRINKDSGVSDSEDDVNRRQSQTRKKKQKEYNNPKDPNNLSEVLQSLAKEKLKTASLTEQNESLQSMVNSKNLASRQLLETENIELEELKEKLKVYENRHQNLSKQYIKMEEKCEELEENNEQLHSEIETIGEYINIYRQQRTALKQMQYQENQNQIKLEEEKDELRAKLEYLVLLVRQLLADRTMLSQDQRDLNEDEINTTEQIYEVIDEVTCENGLEVEPVQFMVEYFGPQQDL